MPMYNSTLFFLTVMLALTSMVAQRHHLLTTLLFLELMILSLSLLLSLTLNSANVFFMLILLTFGACEASMGLALLIMMTRTFGSDLMHTLTLNKC